MDKHYSYLLINALSVAGPLFLSFDKKVAFYKKFKFLIPSLLITGLLYLVWDYIFTINNVWAFSDDYIIGIKFFDLPLEEILFFITIPFACIFIYECLLSYLKKDYLVALSRYLTYFFLIMSLILAVVYHDRLYSLINFGTLFFAMLYLQFGKHYVKPGRFYLAYFVSLLPFYIVNGILTSIPIVTYNNQENMAFRVGTIPFEDHFYSMSLLLINLFFYEYFQASAKAKTN